jgi:hypothetical protein
VNWNTKSRKFQYVENGARYVNVTLKEIWEKLLEIFIKDPNYEWVAIDATFVKSNNKCLMLWLAIEIGNKKHFNFPSKLGIAFPNYMKV